MEKDKPDPNNPEAISLKIHKSHYLCVLQESNWLLYALQITNYNNINNVLCTILKDMFQSSKKFA